MAGLARGAGVAQAGGSASGAGTTLRVALASATNGAIPELRIHPGGDGRAIVDGAPEEARLTLLDSSRARLTTSDGRHDLVVLPIEDARRSAAGVTRLEVVLDGWRFEIDLEPEARALLRERATRARGDLARGGPLELRAIIPGRVVAVDVANGDTVEAGQRMLVIEAMKMQNELRAARAGTISRLAVGAGQTVELGDLLLVVE